MRLRSSTSSCKLIKPSSPLIRVISLLFRKRVRREVRPPSCKEAILVIWLLPSCRTCKRGKSWKEPRLSGAPVSGLVRALSKLGFLSMRRRGLNVHSSPSLLLTRLSTCSSLSIASPLMSTSRLLLRCSSCRRPSSGPRKTEPTSRTFRPETSSSRILSNSRCPSRSSRNSRVRRPLYLDLAEACSAASIGAPSRTFSFRTLNMTYKR
mmetsp:Transcript_22791/g.63009  ORF Transcript_22791/g.63009 Transcript_22791/m.63009 type:complete len:208 (-) Transcript_22791:3255-3878(-)